MIICERLRDVRENLRVAQNPDGLPATEFSSYVSAYRTLSHDGRLEERRVESASEFLASHVELHPTQVPPLIAARTAAKKEVTENLFKETAKVTAASGSTKVVDQNNEARYTPIRTKHHSEIY